MNTSARVRASEGAKGTMPRFAANLGYLFTERPLIERIDAAVASGFKAIELQFPYDVPAAQVKAAIARNGLTMLGVNTPPGEREGEFGLAAVLGREKDFQVLFARALDYAATIGGSAIHCLAGKVAPEQRPAAERVFIDNLKRAADLAQPKNITLLIEPINARDRPHYFLNHVEHAADVIAKAGVQNLRMQFDFYHVQIVGGDLTHRLQQYLPVIGHLQCAAVPTRHEPDEGEVNFPAVFEAVDRLGYRGWIGAEYRPRGRTEDGLGWARAYGIGPPR
jgi:2-dehydrotetronate isomerase